MQSIRDVQKDIQAKVLEILEVKELSQEEDLTMVGLDSIKSIELIVELEAEFNIVFEDNELLLDNFKTINLITELVSQKVAVQK
ncbi:acyl carrier protein [Bacillus toyonensis]|uniref:acyl carrier protein n=1 Tax=Bacillus cereus group TaxID=86661 RepID=UPI0018D08288|nr:acyl carrier protein [Bacillus toyonensis]MBH0357132.1 phosphopantetheine-binding protein [Bacillus toyonensis biovar Thuringiensis]